MFFIEIYCQKLKTGISNYMKMVEQMFLTLMKYYAAFIESQEEYISICQI